MNEDIQPRGRKKDYSWLLIVVGGIVALYALKQFGMVLPASAYGPITIPDPYASVQGGGQGYSVQSLATLSSYGPYSTVG